MADAIPGALNTPTPPKSDSYRLGWLREVVQEGDAINRADPADAVADQAMSYVLGEQISGAEKLPSYVPKMVFNETKRAARRHVSALTDVRPVVGFKTFNPSYEGHAALLNQLTAAWWVNTFADLALGDALKYATVAGTGDLAVEYDPHRWNGMGDQVILPRDYRDTLPYRPSRSPSVQDWQGVVLREEHPTPVLQRAHPHLAHLIKPDGVESPWGRQVFSRFRAAFRRILTPADPLAHLRGEAYTGKKTGTGTTLYRFYFKDPAINWSGGPMIMGEPGRGWTYTVENGQPLYPRGRLIVATETCVLYDGPNPYWHGKFPVTRLRVDPWPWNFLGLGIMHDLMPVQDSINETANTFLSVFRQHAHRGVIADSRIPEGHYRRLDTRQPGWRIKVNPTLGKGVEVVEGPNIPLWSFDFFQFLFQKHAEISGTANLDALLQLRQIPSDATIQKFYEALTPELRLEGRYVELALREMAEMLRGNFFQFYTAARRVMILGDAGLSLSDFDYDPGMLVPALTPDDTGYTPELDAQRTRAERAQFFNGLFTFFIAPNSLLALNAQEEQIKYLQLYRMGAIDWWTFMSKLDMPNVGQPPIVPLPPREGPGAVDLKTAMADPTRYTVQPNPADPLTPTILELRRPETIMEKLMVQSMLGIGQPAEGPAGANPNAKAPGEGGETRGRKASGQQPPQIEEKQTEDGGTRTTVTESSKG